ncbi:TlpA disulfide reductase family protein [Curvibacter sp. APW13]|uniref:TlpA family protein disulfide reductase n=1 Tax=Curvibacter sp. APW13 TaxID=3077236 RepID=UPI0028DE390B|nr:TlpA disulfide reductase family protein [Curvibacter sp. APW13]MDT8991312.1 TlpA disulfide reductase family protein [Curvibacter sp. APW13]
MTPRKALTARLWALFFCLLLGGPGQAWASDGYEVLPAPRGMALPSTLGTDLAGREWTVRDLRGKVVLLNFWASWCEPCRAEMPSLQALQARYGDKLVVLAVNYKESPEAVQRFVQRQGWTLSVLTDPQGALAKRWGIGIFPTSVLISAKGQPMSVVRGEVDWQAMGLSMPWYKQWLGP